MLCCSPLSASKNLLKAPQLHWQQQRKHTVTAASVALSSTATYKDFMIIMPPDDVQEVLLKSSGSEHLSAVISVSEASASFSLISPETTESIPVLKSIHLPGICTLKFQLMSTCWKSLLCLRDDSDVSPEVRMREFSTKSERCVQGELLICSLVSVCDQYLDLSVKIFTLKFKCLQYNIYLYIIDH